MSITHGTCQFWGPSTFQVGSRPSGEMIYLIRSDEIGTPNTLRGSAMLENGDFFFYCDQMSINPQGKHQPFVPCNNSLFQSMPISGTKNWTTSTQRASIQTRSDRSRLNESSRNPTSPLSSKQQNSRSEKENLFGPFRAVKKANFENELESISVHRTRFDTVFTGHRINKRIYL